MRCAECNLYWAEEGENFPSCKANPDWPAPCEYDDEDDEEEEEDPCIECEHAGRGSEHCIAVIGDFCPAGNCYIEDEPSCSTCYNADQDTTDKVACCNCCENYSFYSGVFD